MNNMDFDNLIFDSHAHYDDNMFDEDRDELFKSFPEKGVGFVLNASARADEVPRVLKLAEKYDFVYASVGVHPSEVYELWEDGDEQEANAVADAGDADAGDAEVPVRSFEPVNNFKALKAAISHPKAKAVGEIGLDYHYDDTDKPLQKKWFLKQLDLAKEAYLPIIIHSRDAAADTYEILKNEIHIGGGHGGKNVPAGVIHCYSYEPEMAKLYLELGYYIGVGGVLTFKNGRKLKETVAITPIERIMLETDCPYLAPVPHRGERNDSTYINYVVDTLAEIKAMSREDVIRITTANSRAFYGV